MTHESRKSSELFEAIVYGRKHDAFDSPLGRSLIRAWSVGAADESIVEMIFDQVRPLKTREAFGELVPFRKPRLRNGQILLGTDTNGAEIRIPLRWLTAGVLIAANTGGGKSIFLSVLILQIAAAKRRVWVSDMYKTQIRHLRPYFQRLGLDLVILRPTDWKFNPLQADSSSPLSQLALVSVLYQGIRSSLGLFFLARPNPRKENRRGHQNQQNQNLGALNGDCIEIFHMSCTVRNGLGMQFLCTGSTCQRLLTPYLSSSRM